MSTISVTFEATLCQTLAKTRPKDVSKYLQRLNLMKIHPVTGQLFHADRHNTANAGKVVRSGICVTEGYLSFLDVTTFNLKRILLYTT